MTTQQRDCAYMYVCIYTHIETFSDKDVFLLEVERKTIGND